MDAFVAADPFFSVPGRVDEEHPDGRWKMSEAVFDCKAFTNLKASFLFSFLDAISVGNCREGHNAVRVCHYSGFPHRCLTLPLILCLF